MASSTPNLDLTLPVGGENVSRQIINANNVKIDEAVGAVPSGTDLQSQVTALNNKFPTKVDKTNMTDGESYTYTSQSAMESGLVSLATTVMGANKVRTIFLYPNFTSQIFGGAAGCATIATGSSSSYFTVLFHNYVTAAHGIYLNGTWSWQELALRSDHEINTFVKQINSGANATFTMSECCIVYVMRQTSGTYGIYFIDRWGGVQPVINATNISVSYSNSIITVSNNSGNAIQCVCMIK